MTLARKLTIALGVVALGWLAVLVLWGPAPFAASFDDAYYYFTIGRNWAQGHASTFDGIDRTNGYHPLWQGISIIPYAIGLDGFAAIRSLLVLQLMLWVGSMWLIIRVVTRAVDGWPDLGESRRVRRLCDTVMVAVFVALAANPYLFKMTVNGLESGLVVPVSAALIAVTVGFQGRFVTRATTRQRWMCGVLLALAFLARTDAVILIAIISLWCLLDTGEPTLGWRDRLGRIAQILTVPAAVILVYLVLNQAFFDTPLQISGTLKRLPLTTTRAVVALVWTGLGIGALIGARRPIKRSSRFRRTRRFFAATGWYAAFCVGLLGYYTTLQEVPYLWYFAPLALYVTLLALFAVADLAAAGIRESSRDRVGARELAPAGILVALLVGAFAWTIPSYVDPGTRAIMVHDAAAGRWINNHLPPDARVASWDAGVIGYFAHRHIVNLDGVVNSRAWFDALGRGTTAEFLAERDVGWAANHGGDEQGRDPDIDRQIRAYFGAEQARQITVVFATTYDYTGSLDGSRTDTSTKRMGSYVYRVEP